MSLQRLPPERSLEKPDSAQATEALIPATYSQRQKLKEDASVELIASTIAGIIVAGVTSGFSWAGAFYGVVTFLGVLFLAFVIHLLLSPSALDKGRQEEKQRLLERINGNIKKLPS
jgi:hypothetical protein